MKRRFVYHIMIRLTLAGGLFSGCNSGPCPFTDPSLSLPIDTSIPLYTGSSNPYESGSLGVRTIQLDRCEQKAPFPMLIHAPETPGAYPVIVFAHGFMARNSYYDTILRHLAGHGFIVVAPQMYEPGLGPLLGNPTASQESRGMIAILDWLPKHLDNLTAQSSRLDLLGLAGHSRGGKVIWQVTAWEPDRVQAIAGIDPVDGTGGPLGNQPRVIQGSFAFSIPTLVIGTGLGGDCAPEGDNHEQFYAAANSPAWHIIAINHGHADMLDEGSFGTSFCPGGPDREGMRQLTAGLLVAFFRAGLQGDLEASKYLIDPALAPVEITAQVK